MLHNNNHNSSCNFAEQAVSFLYGEITESEKSGFESHLQSCSSCADELAGFSSVRSSIQEWRAEDFARLATPAFQMPAAKNEPPVSAVWLKSIRSYFSFHPVLSTAGAAGFAALMVFSGWFWFAADTAKNTEIAANNNKTGHIPASSSPVSPSANPDSVLIATNKKDAAGNEPLKPVAQPKNEARKEVSVPLKTAEQSSTNPVQPIKVKKSIPAGIERNNNKATPKTPNRNNIPSLAIDEDEDKTLRLSDILEEVSLK